jgi:uncharacterized RDD family membrane protein YckC
MDQSRYGYPLGQPPQPPHGLDWHRQHEPLPQPYAGFWRRFVASFIDGIMLVIASKVLDVIVQRLVDRIIDPEPNSVLSVSIWLLSSVLFYVVVYWLYFALQESSKWQATPGKRALGIAVTDLTGNRISFGRATGRHFAHLISLITFLIGYLIQPFTERRQALHDIIAGTLVVRTEWAHLGSVQPPIVDPRIGPSRKGGLPGWAVGIVAAVLLLCVGCAAVGVAGVRPLRHKFERSTTNEIADVLTLQISAVPRSTNRLVLDEVTLDINNVMSSGGVKVNWTSDGTTIAGFVTNIDRSGIALMANGTEMYNAVPAIVDDHVDVTAVNVDAGTFLKILLPKKSFEQGLELGINRALASKGLRPTGVTLNNGTLVIAVVPLDGTDCGSDNCIWVDPAATPPNDTL